MSEAPTAPATPAVTESTPTGGSTGHWSQPLGLPPEISGWLQTKGYKTPADAFVGHINAEKAIGADKLVLPPKGQDGNRDWSKFDWGALGRPEAPDKYAVKLPEGYQVSDGDKEFHAAILPAAHKAGLAQWQLDIMAEAFNGYSGGLMQKSQAQQQEIAAALDKTITEKWGAAKDAKLATAQAAAKALGFPPEMLSKLENTVGDFAMLEKLAEIGGKYFAEDNGDISKSAGTGGLMTPADAQKDAAKMDAEAMQAMMKGESHPGHDKRHPEYKAWQEKRNSIYRMAYPDKVA